MFFFLFKYWQYRLDGNLRFYNEVPVYLIIPQWVKYKENVMIRSRRLANTFYYIASLRMYKIVNTQGSCTVSIFVPTQKRFIYAVWLISKLEILPRQGALAFAYRWIPVALIILPLNRLLPAVCLILHFSVAFMWDVDLHCGCTGTLRRCSVTPATASHRVAQRLAAAGLP